MSTNNPRMSKADRREAARLQAERLREERLRKERRTRILIISGVLVVVAAVVAIVVFLLGQASKPELERVAGPSTATEEGVIPVGAEGVAGTTSGPDAPVLRIYSDYLCPACGAFEAMHHEMLGEMRDAGEITIEYHPVAFLDRDDNKNYSSRATSAAATVADRAPEHFVAFHNALFANQPSGGSAWTNEQIREIAVQAGVPEEVADTFGAERFTSWARAVTSKAAREDGVTATPTVMIDGQVFDGDWRVDGALRQAIEEAAG